MSSFMVYYHLNTCRVRYHDIPVNIFCYITWCKIDIASHFVVLYFLLFFRPILLYRIILPFSLLYFLIPTRRSSIQSSIYTMLSMQNVFSTHLINVDFVLQTLMVIFMILYFGSIQNNTSFLLTVCEPACESLRVFSKQCRVSPDVFEKVRFIPSLMYKYFKFAKDM